MTVPGRRTIGQASQLASENTGHRVTVVGGGFVGAIFAHHLLRESAMPVDVEILDERAEVGRGVAYSATQPHQTTNIPASRMSVYPEDRQHFERWLDTHATGQLYGGYPHRSLFGTYVGELLRNTEPRHPGSRLNHRQLAVSAVARSNDGFAVSTADGGQHGADAVVLATGNPAPAVPAPLVEVATDQRVILDPWQPDALACVRATDRILMLGIGLTMGETLAGLKAAGHQGAVLAIARRGRRFARGAVEAPTPFGQFGAPHPITAVQLLQQFRAEVRRAEAAGLSWRSVLAAAREQGWAMWRALPVVERRRVVRHLRPFYEAIRHVMPSPVYDLIEGEERSGRVRIVAASLEKMEPHPEGLSATLRMRGERAGQRPPERFDRVINCTGPAYGTLLTDDPFWSGLAQAGLVSRDPVGLGIAVGEAGHALDCAGIAQRDLLVLGTLARGAFGELTGVGELSPMARIAACALVEGWSLSNEILEPARKVAAR